MGLVYEYDPAADKWTKKKPMPLPSHHVSFTEHKGKIYAFGGFVLPQSGPPAWVPIDNAWEYDPASDSWRALAPVPTKRGSPVAVSAGERMYVIGGAVAGPGQPAVHPARPHTSVGAVEEYDPAANTWRARAPMPTPRNHMVGGAINGKIYVASGRVGAAFISGGSAVEERIFAGTPKEMVTMYHDKNGKLALTHYCMLANRPGMLLESSDARTLKFDFDPACGLDAKSEMHMHSLSITFESPDMIVQDWKLFEDGKNKDSHPFTLKRVKV